MRAAKDFPGLADIHWEGDSRQVLAGFPEDVRADFGFALYELQLGKLPSMVTRRMESVGPGVFELKQSDKRTWYRVIYLSKVGNAIHVLHCFEKRSRKTDERDLRTARQRFRLVQQRIMERRKNAKQNTE